MDFSIIYDQSEISIIRMLIGFCCAGRKWSLEKKLSLIVIVDVSILSDRWEDTPKEFEGPIFNLEEIFYFHLSMS
jgi:hypothetical protein